MIFLGRFFLIIFLIAAAPVSAASLTKSDFDRLSTAKVMQYVVFESYLETDKGIANVIGFHYDTYISDSVFLKATIFGAVGGHRGGYGIAAFGMGHRYNLGAGLSLNSAAIIGSGGGGGLPAGGGLALEAMTGLDYEFFEGFFLGSRVGYLSFPSGSFQTPIINVSFSYRSRKMVLPF
jgi:hypothetical protein